MGTVGPNPWITQPQGLFIVIIIILALHYIKKTILNIPITKNFEALKLLPLKYQYKWISDKFTENIQFYFIFLSLRNRFTLK